METSAIYWRRHCDCETVSATRWPGCSWLIVDNIREWQNRLRGAIQREREVREQIDRLEAKLGECRRSMAPLDVCYFSFYHSTNALTVGFQHEIQRAQSDCRTLREVRDNLQVEANEELPAGIAGLQGAKEVCISL